MLTDVVPPTFRLMNDQVWRVLLADETAALENLPPAPDGDQSRWQPQVAIPISREMFDPQVPLPTSDAPVVVFTTFSRSHASAPWQASTRVVYLCVATDTFDAIGLLAPPPTQDDHAAGSRDVSILGQYLAQ